MVRKDHWRFTRSVEFERLAVKRCTSELAAKVISNYLSGLRNSCSKAGKKANATRKAQAAEEKECGLRP